MVLGTRHLLTPVILRDLIRCLSTHYYFPWWSGNQGVSAVLPETMLQAVGRWYLPTRPPRAQVHTLNPSMELAPTENPRGVKWDVVRDLHTTTQWSLDASCLNYSKWKPSSFGCVAICIKAFFDANLTTSHLTVSPMKFLSYVMTCPFKNGKYVHVSTHSCSK